MQKILLVITIVAAGAAAFFGFQAKQTITDAKQQIAKVIPGVTADQDFKGIIGAISTNEQSQKSKVATAEKNLKTTQGQLSDTQQQLKTANDSVAPLKASLASATDQIKQLNTQIESDKSQLTDLQTKVSGGEGAQGSIVALTKQVTDLQAELKTSQAKALELKQVASTLTAKAATAENTAKTLQTAEDHRQHHIMAMGLEGTVLAYNPNWNFIVISIGDHQGVVANAEMVVKRGDEMIAKVRVNNVGPSTAVADIIPGTVARGVRVQPGDRVIYTGS